MSSMLLAYRLRRSRWVPLTRAALLVVFYALTVRSDAETTADPVREMLLAHFQTVQGGYRRMINRLVLPTGLGLGRADLRVGLDSLEDALAHWKIQFLSSYAAFAVQTTTHLLVVNPQSMPQILEEDDDVLLHESVHLTASQVQRQLYGLHSELVFLNWLGDHLNEEKAAEAESKLNRTLRPDDILRLRLWSSPLKSDPVALRAAEQTLRMSWICETQAYYVQMLVFDDQLKQQGAKSLKGTADRLRKTLASETGFQKNSASPDDSPGLVGEDDMALTLFQSFNAGHVSDGFQEAVLSCVLMDSHKGLIFRTLAEADGWNIQTARKNPPYRRRLYRWARQKVLRWDTNTTDSYTLNENELNELRKNGLMAEDPLINPN